MSLSNGTELKQASNLRVNLYGLEGQIHEYLNVKDFSVADGRVLQFFHLRPDGVMECIVTTMPFKVFAELIDAPPAK